MNEDVFPRENEDFRNVMLVFRDVSFFNLGRVSKNTNQVIQAVTFLSPNVGGHQNL